MPPGHIFRTAEAIADLDGIWEYVARDNPVAADKMLEELNERFILLANNPEIGELQLKLANGSYRRFTSRTNVIYYRPLNDGIVLVRVLHGTRDHEALL